MPASRTTGSSTSTSRSRSIACHLAGEFGYVDGGAVTGVFRTTEPFPVEIDLDALL